MGTETIHARPAQARGDELLFVPKTGDERGLVQEHLEKVLAGTAFRQSKRYAAVLRFLVERRLSGQEEQLKERTIGIEVFGRAADYDTATDHVVRSAAAEIRRRLAQYYQEEGSRDALRIELQRGGYLPQFHMAIEQDSAPETTLVLAEAVAPEAAVSAAGVGGRQGFRWRVAGAIAAVLVVIAASLAMLLRPADGAIGRFWRPLLNAGQPILLCVGTVGSGRQMGEPPPAINPRMTLSEFHSFEYELVLADDAETLARIAGLMEKKGKPYGIASEAKATYADLQKGPAVLIGLMNNDWTERLVQNLRFSVVRTSPYVMGIRDRDNPQKNDWSIDYSTPYLSLTRDYAIVVRSSDPKTGQMTVTIAGLSVFGTRAAGRFVTDPDELKQLEAIAPRGWEQKNLELVLTVDVIRGVPGPPVLLASRFW